MVNEKSVGLGVGVGLLETRVAVGTVLGIKLLALVGSRVGNAEGFADIISEGAVDAVTDGSDETAAEGSELSVIVGNVDGLLEGSEVLGEVVGDGVGSLVTGATVGGSDTGETVGGSLTGDALGVAVGGSLTGDAVGANDGLFEGIADGLELVITVGDGVR